jgi:hypothetical protein
MYEGYQYPAGDYNNYGYRGQNGYQGAMGMYQQPMYGYMGYNVASGNVNAGPLTSGNVSYELDDADKYASQYSEEYYDKDQDRPLTLTEKPEELFTSKDNENLVLSSLSKLDISKSYHQGIKVLASSSTSSNMIENNNVALAAEKQ